MLRIVRDALSLGLATSVASTACVVAAPAASPRPAYCAQEAPGELRDVTDSPASPYFVRDPLIPPGGPVILPVETVVFLPGGSGLTRHAQRIWDTFLAGARDVDRFRIVIPHVRSLDLIEDLPRIVDIVDEVLACYGGDPARVHLAGFSNGGHAAFALMLERPSRFATLLGAPGEFPPLTQPADWAKALAGKRVFNGTGELDEEWRPEVLKTHERLLSVGVDSVYVEFRGQGHGAREGFPTDVLFEFWSKRPAR